MPSHKPLKTMCACCTRVLQGERDKIEDWGYEPHDYSVDYSHGYCPKCYEVELEKVNQYIKTKG